MQKFRKLTGSQGKGNGRPRVRKKAPSPDASSHMLIDVEGLARMLAISPSAIRSMHKRGQIPEEAVVRVGRRLRFHVARIQEWIDGLANRGWSRAV